MRVLTKIRLWLGELWWWSAWHFLAARTGDVINVFIGVWLVPHYVSQEELGAVLPLLQVSTTFGWPLSVLVTVFMKFLNEYHTKREAGKVKSLILMFIGFSMLFVVAGSAVAAFLMPHFFERIRVTSGSLGVLVILCAILGTVQPVFMNGLMALKRFKEVTILNFTTGPIRFIVMVIAMPVRALSGYMLAQVLVPAVQIAMAGCCFRREVRGAVKSVPFWREDGRRIACYTMFVALSTIGLTLFMMSQVLVIRQRLPAMESAAYYMISRFSEMASYLGATVSGFLFPLAMEAHVKGRESVRLLFQTLLGATAFGSVAMLVLAVFGRAALSVLPGGEAYVAYVPDMVLLTAGTTLGVLVTTFISYETANDRFSFVSYITPLLLGGAVFLMVFTGYGYFSGVLPDSIVTWMASLKIATLRNVLVTITAVNALCVGGAVIQLLARLYSVKALEKLRV